MRSSPFGRRAAVALLASLGMGLSGFAVLGTSAAAHADGSNCDTPYPITSLHEGDPVTGLTVTSGTAPSGFTGSYLGDLKDGIAPGIDMLMFKLDSADIRQDGIWEGMSGSPVYASNGQLIGAVAYSLSYGASPIAGVTPYADMDSTMPDAPAQQVRVPDAMARRIADASRVSTSQARQGAHALQIPLQANVSARRLNKIDGRHKAAHHKWSPQRYLADDVVASGGSTTDAGPTAADIVPGGNLAATMSTGDITMAGVGTVTSVCQGRVVGFGHPMNFLGKTTYGLAGADALLIQPDPLGSSFKLANIGDLLGTVDQDRMTGISGSLGVAPASMKVSSEITYDGTSRTGESDVQTRTADATASVTNYELSANGDRVLDAWMPGSEKQDWTITGTGPAGPFTIDAGNRYVSNYDITFDSSWDLPDLVYLLGNVPGVSVESVTSTARASDGTDTYRIIGVQQKRQGKWRVVTKGHPAQAVAGRMLHVRVKLSGATHNSFVGMNLSVPKKARGMHGPLWISRADGYPFEMGMPHTLPGVMKMVNNMVRNDQAAASGFLSSSRSPQMAVLSGKSATSSKVLRGNVRVPVRVS